MRWTGDLRPARQPEPLLSREDGKTAALEVDGGKAKGEDRQAMALG